MSRIIPKGTRDNLNLFAGMVWGNAQAVLAESEGVEYIDLQSFLPGFRYLFGGAIKHNKILVRDEYRTALQALQADTYENGAYVIGQPGIGKTLFLVYILVARLGNKQTVAVQLTNGVELYALFRHKVTFHSLDDLTPLDKHHPVWALSDSNAYVQCPPGIFTSSTMPGIIQVIQTTSPKGSRWKEWSKQTGAQCYVMDIWSKEEVADLAKLLERDVKRMTTLAEKLGGVPRTLIECSSQEDQRIEGRYRGGAKEAVRKCDVMLAGAAEYTIPDNPPSTFYFFRPLITPQGIVRQESRLHVPTPTLRRLLGEALQGQNNTLKLEFFNALSQPDETRQAAGFIYESWFHSFFSTAETIQCEWLQDSGSTISSVQGTSTLIPATGIAPKSATPPYYWVAPKKFPGIDSALILEQEIFAFQVTISSEHQSPLKGLQTLRNTLPDHLKDIPWNVVFVGQEKTAIKGVAKRWAGKVFFPTKERCVPVGWSVVDPVQQGVVYKEFDDAGGSEDTGMEVDVEAGEE